MLVYATVDDLADWIDPLPDNAESLLKTASLRVREATKTAWYAVGVSGLPTDTAIAEAMRDATCVHAAALSTAGLNPTAGGVLTKAGVATSKSVGSASVSYADAKSAAEAKAALLTTLCPDAALILQQAGLMPDAVWAG